ncbi:MAG: hypothetical protein ACR2QB_12490, partial [Gammaproteobacteria bacterium]
GMILLVGVHIFTPRFRFLRGQAGPWISASAGVAIAYVFIDILPLLASQQAKLMETPHTGWLRYLERHAYMVAMAGFVFYYGIALNRRAMLSRNSESAGESPSFFRSGFTVISSLAYSFLIAYLLGEKWDHGSEPGIIFALAMSLHFVGLNYLSYEDDPVFYRRWLRYELVIATVAGWLLGIFTAVSDQVFLLAFSFLAGGIIVVAMAVELPRIQPSRIDFLAFVGGAVAFSGLLLTAH